MSHHIPNVRADLDQVLADDVCPATRSAPCVICGTCHYNACNFLWGGNPERPDCDHNKTPATLTHSGHQPTAVPTETP